MFTAVAYQDVEIGIDQRGLVTVGNLERRGGDTLATIVFLFHLLHFRGINKFDLTLAIPGQRILQ